jgi:hypothetical protein
MLRSILFLFTISLSFKAIFSNYEQQKIVLEFLQRLNSHTSSDQNFLAKYLSEECSLDFMFHHKPQSKKGLEEIKNLISLYWRKTPDAKDKIVEIFSLGNVILVEGIFTGTFPNGERMEIPYIEKFTMKFDKIKHIALYSDFHSYFKGIGETQGFN